MTTKKLSDAGVTRVVMRADVERNSPILPPLAIELLRVGIAARTKWDGVRDGNAIDALNDGQRASWVAVCKYIEANFRRK